jgi:hypothetical protein
MTRPENKKPFCVGIDFVNVYHLNFATVAYDYFSFELLPADSRPAQKSVHDISSSFIPNAHTRIIVSSKLNAEWSNEYHIGHN